MRWGWSRIRHRLEAKLKWPLLLSDILQSLYFIWTWLGPAIAILYSLFLYHKDNGVRFTQPAWIYQARYGDVEHAQTFQRSEVAGDVQTPSDRPEIIQFDDKILAPPHDESVIVDPYWSFRAPISGFYLISVSIYLGRDEQENSYYLPSEGHYQLSLRRTDKECYADCDLILDATDRPKEAMWPQMLAGTTAIKLEKSETISFLLTLRIKQPIKTHGSKRTTKVVISLLTACKSQSDCR